MRNRQTNLSGVNDSMILFVSVFFLLLRLFLYFSINLKESWVERYIMPLLQYKEAFDFCSFVLFLITIYVFIYKSERGRKRLFSCVLLNFINTIVCWNYAPKLWLKIQGLCSWLVYRLQTSEEYAIGFYLLIFLVLMRFLWGRLEGKTFQYLKKFWNSVKQNGSCIYWLILLILGIFFGVQTIVKMGYLAGLKVTKLQKVAEHSLSIVAIFSVVSIVYICVQAVKGIRNKQTISFSVIFLDVCLSLWGITSIRFYTGKLAMSGKEFWNVILAGIELVIAFMVALAGVLLWKGAVRCLHRNVGRVKRKDKRFWFAICVSGSITIFVFIALIIIFVKWGEQINNYFTGLNSKETSMNGILGFWGTIVFFAITGIIVLGGISLLIYEVFRAVLQKEKKPSEWIVLLMSFVMTGLSLYIYYQIEPERKMVGIAENVAEVFAFPVVLMAWYVIMTGLLANFSGFLKDSSRIKQKLAKEMENLILDSINAIFAPFYFSANYLSTLRDAVLDDSDEEGGAGSSQRKQWKSAKECCRVCYIWLKKCFKKGRFKR